ncbi:thiolase C-terminal domain-containing protein [Nocardia jiangxiensis]|uniref:Thiolase family protein n=1 Tax=Nocardia jiangxiensis TaxID=282685 RepID=A0ABW6SA19_9NOCA|nr:thiolase family protein [Nocardia jiangxiensis]
MNRVTSKVPTTAVVGLGVTEMGKIYGRSTADFAAEAIALALADAGLGKSDVDGLLINGNGDPAMEPRLQFTLGLENLRMLNSMRAFGSTVGSMVQYASLALDAHLVDTVVLVYAATPLQQNVSASAAYAARGVWDGMNVLKAAYGEFGGNPPYALAARRHMHEFGTTSEQFGAIAVAQRKWAGMNPAAQIKKPLSLEDHQASRMIVDPFHLFDCCLVSNGAVAVVMTRADRARDLRQPPVYLLAATQAAPGDNQRTGIDPAISTGARQAGEEAFRIANIHRDDVDVLELYDCYTYTVLVTLEDYGYCAKGEGGAFVSDGKLGPGGSLPTNTGGGQLSSYYMWGFTPLAEAIIQARGQAGERQIDKHDIVLASANGGVLNFHSTTIWSRHAA